MKVESIAIESLAFDPANARKHSVKNLDAIKGSLARFGQQKPIVIGKNNVVIAGNGTLEAARSLGWDQIDVVRTDLEGIDATAFALADNRTAELAEWDTEILSETLKALDAMDFDLESIGFDESFMQQAEQGTEGLTYPDEVPEHVETRCKPGDLWLLGKHRLLCGDSTNVQHVERLMGGEKADFVYMDPPYGMNLNTNYARGNRVVGKTYSPVIGDDQDFDPRFWFEFFGDAREHFWWGADYYCQHLPKGGAWVVWDKKKDDLDESIGAGFELCWSKLPHKRMLARFLWSGFTAKERNEGCVHPTQKPVALHEWFFARWGKDSDLVVDLFQGSGSTLIACEKTGRRCFGMEIDPKYCDVIIERWERFTGKTAEISGD